MLCAVGRGRGPFVVREFNYDNLYYEVTYKAETYAYCHVQIHQKIAYIHLYMQKWSKSLLKALRADFKELKKDLRYWGVSLLIGTHPLEGSDKWCKFLKLLGFVGMTETTTAEGELCKLTFMEVA